MDKRQGKIFKILKTLAESSDFVSNAAVTACLVYKNEIIAFGENSGKSHPFQQRFSKNAESIYFHAETNCIYNALKKLSLKELEKSDLYVLRVKRDNSVALSKPCPGCFRAILTFKLRNVYYTVDDSSEFVKL